MKRSLSLALYLLAAARGGKGEAPPRPLRPEGRLIWVHAGAGATPRSIGQLLRRLCQTRTGIALVVTGDCDKPLVPVDFPDATNFDATPEDRQSDIRAFLEHWQPDLFILAGASLPPAMIVEVRDQDIPALLIDVRVAPGRDWMRLFRGGMAAALLSRFDRILAQDPDTARRLRRIAGRQISVEVTGRIEETRDPLKCNEAERTALAELLQARPVWFAVACPQAEEAAVLAAQTHALRLAHRMLLILSPADPSRLGALKDICHREGWTVAARAEDEEPEPEVQVLLTEGEAEMGLWYRLAPVTYMGGTLMPGGSGRNPYEPAALGSAILHGPHPGPYPDAYARLSEAGASRLVASPAALAEAVADLIAPDKTAQLAHNAWAASSGGAEVTERVMQIILDLMDARAASGPKEA
jgi:3-deoxy-D-manno-octulosonic-acid transferase